MVFFSFLMDEREGRHVDLRFEVRLELRALEDLFAELRLEDRRVVAGMSGGFILSWS